MSDHLSHTTLNALADGELSAPQLADANRHLAACPACTTAALQHSLLKSATARAGQRFTPPPHLQQCITRFISQEAAASPQASGQPATPPRPMRGFALTGWASACALLLLSVSLIIVQRNNRPANDTAALLTEVFTEITDQHIATLAANAPPQVISTDRHTVKPWFQGKLPFSFNLPAELPDGITLDGANLTYLHSKPTAQLLFSIGKHHASVFLQQRSPTTAPTAASAEHAGFHIAGFTTQELEAIAVSDADPTRLADLVSALYQAQTNH